MQTFKRLIRPDPDIWLDEYAEKEYQFPQSSRFPGPYDFTKTPYTREILRELTPLSTTREVVVMGPTQAGKTEISNVAMFGLGKYYPSPGLFVFPTDDMVLEHLEKKIDPAFEVNAESLRWNISNWNPETRKPGGRRNIIKFKGGTWKLAAIQASGTIRSTTARYVFATDVDSDQFVSKLEGDPLDVLEKRMDAYGFDAKFYIESTPRLRGVSLIERKYNQSSMGRYFIPCLKCGHFQWLRFGGVAEDYGFKFSRWKDGLVRDAWHLCENCHNPIFEKDKYRFMNAGQYVHEHNDNPVRGFRFNAFHSPLGFVSWIQMAAEWLRAAKGSYSQVQVFFNTRLSRTYEIPGTERVKWQALKNKAEPYQLLTLPPVPSILSLGVDTHDNRLTVLLVAYGNNSESWVLFSGDFPGDPNNSPVDEPWKSYMAFCNREFERKDGVRQRILSIAQDMKGHREEAVKRAWRHYSDDRWILIRGAASKTGPLIGMPRMIDAEMDGQKIKEGAQYWPVNVHLGKTEVFSGFKDGAINRAHFSDKLEDEFYKQLTAEELTVTINKHGYPVQEWTNTRPGSANHALDCFVYSLAGVTRIFPTIPLEHVGRIRYDPPKPKEKYIKPQKPKRRGRFDW